MERMGRDRIWNKGNNLHWPYSNTGKKWKGKGLFCFFLFFFQVELIWWKSNNYEKLQRLRKEALGHKTFKRSFGYYVYKWF